MAVIFDIDGTVLREWPDPPPEPANIDAVDSETERRIAAGFPFMGKVFQARDKDLVRMSGGALNATLAIMNGAQPGDVRWAGGDSDFGWIALDNSVLAMDAQTMVAFGQAAASFISRLTFAGRALKDRLLAGEMIADVAADEHWS